MDFIAEFVVIEIAEPMVCTVGRKGEKLEIGFSERVGFVFHSVGNLPGDVRYV